MNPILVALDVSTAEEAENLATSVLQFVGGFKVGLELMMSTGPEIVGRVSDLGLPVFADAKLHDIPSTVGKAAFQIGRQGARWVTVHASGGVEMMRAGVEGLNEGTGGVGGILAVTVLTSIDISLLRATGVDHSIEDQVQVLARLADEAGAEGVICSPLEIEIAKTAAPELLAITPGIRPAGVGSQDQRRMATPSEALDAGADYLVIGRPITAADDPADAAAAIAGSLENA